MLVFFKKLFQCLCTIASEKKHYTVTSSYLEFYYVPES